MRHRVVLTDEAERSLQEIGDYIALDNLAAASEFIRRVRTRIMSLADFPTRYRVRNRLGHGRRLMVIGHYVVVYRLEADVVYVERVSEGSRDIERLLEGE